MNASKTLKILEKVWLVIGFIGIVMCAYSIIINDNRSALYFLVFTVVAGVMYSVRKRQRKKYEAAHSEKEEQK